MRRSIVAALLLLLATGLAEAAGPASSSPWMGVGARTSQPIGHYDFCRRHPAQCGIPGRSSAPLRLDAKLWGEIVAVNDQVNARIRPATDMEVWGKEEYWEYPTTAGDCDDYMLEKQRELMALGLPANTLLLTVVRQPNGEGHAVLTVRTDRGDFILDNLDGRILAWNKTDYSYLKRQSTANSGLWVSIRDDRDIPVGSIRD